MSIFNTPGLSAITYRIGTFTSFRRAMLDAVARPDRLDRAMLDAVGRPDLPDPAPNPFAGWREGTAGDYQTMLIELWAYLADILTFYQERIANEAFITTATQRDSLARLTGLIDYHPGPGSGASALVAFTVQKDKVVTIPPGFRTGSQAQPGKPAAVFETESGLTARGEHNAIPLAATAPINQFAPLPTSARGGAPPATPAPVPPLSFWPGVAAGYFFGSPAGKFGFSSVPYVSTAPLSAPYQPSFTMVPTAPPTALRTIVLEGANNRLAVGDYVLAVGSETKDGEKIEKTHVFRIATVSSSKKDNTTTLTWEEPIDTTWTEDVALYALRVSAGLFGNTAPRWDSLSPTLTNIDQQHSGAPYEHKNWDGPTSWFYVPTPDDPLNILYLDAVYNSANGTPDRPDWAVLLDGTAQAIGSNIQVLHVIDARQVSKAAYTMTSKVTRLTFRESVRTYTFPVRSAVLLTGSEPLTLHNDRPLPDPVSGSTLILAGVRSSLQAGQTVILSGRLWDPGPATPKPADIAGAESGILAGPPIVDPEHHITTVTLKQPLASQYVRAGAVLMANVVDATQGETVRDEVLGSGDGSAFQSFPLKQQPLTYLPSTDPEGLAAVQSTLFVTVNGVHWRERPTLLESAPDAQEFSTSLDDAGRTMVVFGDGVTGSPPPSGRDNIRARYRKGLGVPGNAPVGAVRQLIDSIPGLQQVTNPQPASGGADQERIDQIRRNAPASVRTFGRAVSAEDYAALARTYPGIAKASASWVVREANLLAAPHPYVRLTIATTDRVPLAQQPVLAGKLRSFLDRHRDPNVPLRILDFTPVYIDVAVTVDVDDRFPREATRTRVQAALHPGPGPDGSVGYFAFERLGFGQSIYLSAVYAAVQAVPGVSDVRIMVLRRTDAASADPTDILIRPTEIAIVGTLTVTLGQGGFVDT